MANAFFEPGTQRAARVNALFGRVARRYDLINDLQSFGLHRLWKRRLVELANPGPADRALDLCCGTGDIALRLAEAGAHVVGLDFSAPMLEVAKARSRKSRACAPENRVAAEAAAEHPAPAITWLQGDAQQVPFPAASFDIVTVGYGLRNLADWEVGLREMARVARPGARLLVLDFGKPDNALWRCLYFTYLRLFVPLLGLCFCGSAYAYAYILESLKHYPAQHGVAERMRVLGLRNVRILNLLGGVMTINYAEMPPAGPGPATLAPPA